MSTLLKRLSLMAGAMKPSGGDDKRYCEIRDFVLLDTTVDEILNLKDEGFEPSLDDLNNTMVQIARSPCKDIRPDVIPAILAQYYTPKNLSTLIRYLNEKLKTKYQFNHYIRLIISGKKIEDDLLIKEYGKKGYLKMKEKIQKKAEERMKKNFNADINELLKNDRIIISRMLLAINCLEIVMKQIISEAEINSEADNSGKVGKQLTGAKRELDAQIENLGKALKIYIDIEPQYVPSYYTFDKDLSKEAQSSKTKAWKSFRDDIDDKYLNSKYLNSKDFGQLKAFEGKTIADNYKYIKKMNEKIPLKALYYLVFKINQLYNNLSDDEQKDFKKSLKKDVRAQPEESDNVCNSSSLKKEYLDKIETLSKQKNDYLDEIDTLSKLKDKKKPDDDRLKLLLLEKPYDDDRLKFLLLLKINANNPNKFVILNRACDMNPQFKEFRKEKDLSGYYEEGGCQPIPENEPPERPPKTSKNKTNQPANELAIKLAQELRAKLKPLETSTDNTALTEKDIEQLLEKKKQEEEKKKKEEENAQKAQEAKNGQKYINLPTITDEKEFFNTPTKPKSSKFGKKRSYGVSRRRDRSKKRSAKRRTIKKKSIRKKPRAF